MQLPHPELRRRERGVLTGVQTPRRVTACDMGLTPARAVQGRDAEQAGARGHLEAQNFLPTWYLGEDGDL